MPMAIPKHVEDIVKRGGAVLYMPSMKKLMAYIDSGRFILAPGVRILPHGHGGAEVQIDGMRNAAAA